MDAGVRGSARLGAAYLVAAILTACGGGGGGSSDAPVPVVAKPVVIIAAGDSTMAGLVQNPDKSYTITGDYVANVRGMLQQKYGDVTIVNHSVTATTLNDALTGGEGYTATLAQYLSTSPAQIVVENYAINDFAKVDINDYRNNLVQFVTMVRAAGKIPVLEEPNPICHPATAPQDVEEWDNQGRTIASFVEVIDQVAAQYGVALVAQYKPILALPNWCSLMSDSWAHPSPQLYQIKAANEASVLGPLVKQIQ